jgi:TonB family protein
VSPIRTFVSRVFSAVMSVAILAALTVCPAAWAQSPTPVRLPACRLAVGAIVVINPTTYGLILGSGESGPAAVHVEFFSDTDDFALHIDGVKFDAPPDAQPSPATGVARTLRSAPYFIHLPKAADLVAARAQQLDDSGSPFTFCAPQYTFTDYWQSQLTPGMPLSDEARTLRQTLRHAFLAGAPTLAALETIARTSQRGASCPERYRMARTTRPVVPNYPALARTRGVRGVSYVAVTLDATGAVTEAHVYQSSRSKELDDAALDAARRSGYAPEVFRCEPVSGTYLFRAEFTYGRSP